MKYSGVGGQAVMEGVMILDSYTIGGFDGGALVAGILFAIVALCALIIAIILASDGESTAFFLLVAVVACMVFSVIAFCEVDNGPEETVYKVIVDDSVPMNEFYSRYEIIDQEGLIYEVKEKTK